MGTFPSDFVIPMDEGGLGQGQPIGGFGGDATKNQAEHRAALRSLAKAPVILIHGNAGAADSGQWDMLDLKEMLLAAGYVPELIWAPSYLGPGGVLESSQPHIKNIDDVRQFTENVCAYLDVQVVDIIAHSLGCSLSYATFRGLEKQPSPPYAWSHPQKWHRVGTFVALAGAFHGLSPCLLDQSGEWCPQGPFMQELLNEQSGGGGETPFSEGSPQTDPPAHNIVYFCGIARGDFVDDQNPDTGMLNGAVNMVYNLGQSTLGHERIKENSSVFADFLPLLNSVPPLRPTTIDVDRASGAYDGPLQITVRIEPADKSVAVEASRMTKAIENGILSESILDHSEVSLLDGESTTLENNGLWEVVFRAEGADEMRRTYWVGVEAIEVVILTDNKIPFKTSLDVLATTTRGDLYHSFNGQMWTLGANPTITEDAVVYFVAVDAQGIASAVVSKAFKKAPDWEKVVTANAIAHFIAGRIDVTEYMSYSHQFGFFTPFKLYLVDDDWVLDPNAPHFNVHAPVPEALISESIGRRIEPTRVKLSAHDRIDVSPRIYYTLDGSRPTVNSPFLLGSGQITLKAPGSQTLKYFARNTFGRTSEITTQKVDVTARAEPVIRVSEGYPLPGTYTQTVTTRIEAVGPENKALDVYYSLDGSLPDSESPVFTQSREFEVSGRGNHAISCCLIDSAGRRHLEVFHYSIDDQQYPETSIAPSRGGHYAGFVQVVLTPSEPVEWTKYTLDETVPDADNGKICLEPIPLTSNTILKWRSLDLQGNLEPVNTAVFEIIQEKGSAVFDNDRRKNGYIKFSPETGHKMIGGFANLSVGTDRSGMVSRAILHFDTAELPDNAHIHKAYLQLRFADPPPESISGPMVVDVRSGYFGSSLALQIDDWDAPASADAVAVVERVEGGTMGLAEFSAAGLEAINKTGPTQIRLRFEPAPSILSQPVRFRPGGAAKLIIEYQVEP
jgi:pimeloyl-ACP methyl ester carboxylesterase